MSSTEPQTFCQHDPEVPIRNFRRVTPFFFRGGQPGQDGIDALAAMGVKTVVNLRWGDRTVEAERGPVERAGMKFISMPLAYWFLPNDQTINSFLEIVDNEANHPVFLHCLHGKDRTGLFTAIFRMARQGWTVNLAYKEMKACGFHRFRVRNFKWLLWRFARKHNEKAV